MLLQITSILLLISNFSLAAFDNDQNNNLQQCQLIGQQCQTNDDCCAKLNCYSIEENNLCLPLTSESYWKRSSDDAIIPPYYNPNNQLYPYGISKPTLPLYRGQASKQVSHNKNLEWDYCQFHEDCGEGNCCYVHFRFRSLPKWFCRSNRDANNSLCEPLAKYRSLKDVPAWKQQERNKDTQQQR